MLYVPFPEMVRENICCKKIEAREIITRKNGCVEIPFFHVKGQRLALHCVSVGGFPARWEYHQDEKRIQDFNNKNPSRMFLYSPFPLIIMVICHE